MRILLIADGRSPITRKWVQALLSQGNQVILVTTFPCAPLEGVEADVCLPVAFSSLLGSGGSGGGGGTKPASPIRRVLASFRPFFQALRYRFGPLTLQYYGPRLRWLVERIEPDLVHALRVPYEGMLASWTPEKFPLVVSIWGNDFTLHAQASASMADLTHRAMARADGLMADAGRDIRLAHSWGLAEEKPALVIPGNGGLNLVELEAIRNEPASIPEVAALFTSPKPLVINPRGFRTGSVRQDTFFQAVPLILEQNPEVNFACAAMAGQREALQWIERLHLEGKVQLLPVLPQEELWKIFAHAAVTVSVSQHDGTPNSLLEAMAFGALPVAGDIESIREWIVPGMNGLLVEPDKPQSLADAVLLALENQEFRQKAAAYNAEVVQQRVSAAVTREKITDFYQQVIFKKTETLAEKKPADRQNDVNSG
jgi:glycosyltransferase involved in cell wall biosynthesis